MKISNQMENISFLDFGNLLNMENFYRYRIFAGARGNKDFYTRKTNIASSPILLFIRASHTYLILGHEWM